MGKGNIPRPEKIAYFLLKDVNRAIHDYSMIEDGDRIAVGVSGGKDSLALLHLLRIRQASVLEKYELTAVHVLVEGFGGTTPCADPATVGRLEAYLQSQDQPYAVERITGQGESGCFRCSSLRRRALFTTAERLGCNKIALGHHQDDAAQTTLLNLVCGARTETLWPRREFFDGRFSLIRPLIYLCEKDLLRFVRALDLLPLAPPCPQSAQSGRAIVREAIRSLQAAYPDTKANLLRAGLRSGLQRASSLAESPDAAGESHFLLHTQEMGKTS